MLFYVCLVLLLGSVFSSGPCAPNENLLTFLQGLHAMSSYPQLSADNRALLPELVSEAESCQLTAYIYTVGFHKILNLMDSLSHQEAHFFSSYLQQHLILEKQLAAMHPPTTKAPQHSSHA